MNKPQTPQDLIDAIWVDAESLYVSCITNGGQHEDKVNPYQLESMHRIFEALDNFAILNGLKRPSPFGTTTKIGSGVGAERKHFPLELDNDGKAED